MGPATHRGTPRMPSFNDFSSAVRTVVVSLGLVIALASPASAQAAADDDARAHFDAGRAAYAEGRFDAAVLEFRRAYVLSGRFALLFNIGMAELRAGNDSAALTAFEGYRRQAPADAPDLGQVEERIRVLRGMGVVPDEATIPPPPAEDEPEAEAETPPPLATLPAEEPRSVAPLLVIGSGAALVVTGGVLMGLGAVRARDVTDAPTGSHWTDVQDTADRAKLLWGLGLGVGIAGLAAVGGGATWSIVRRGSSDAEPAVTANLRIGAGFVALEGAF